MSARHFLGGLAAGAGLVYLLDPDHGAERRATLRERAGELWSDLGDAIEERVAPGAHAAHAAVRRRVHGREGDLPGIDWSEYRRGGSGRRLTATGAAIGVAGGALAAYGFSRRGQLGRALRALGTGMLVKGLRDADLAPGSGFRERRRAIDVQQSFDVAAPPARVFAFARDWANYPRFLSHVREVRDLGDGRTHWTVRTPAGVPLEWTAAITELVPGESIGWRSEPGSEIDAAGLVRVRPQEDGSRLELRLWYAPPEGSSRHATDLLGADPKRRIDQDMERLRDLLAAGTRPAAQQGDVL